MGVGRSGTTAIYSLLQAILERNSPGDVDYVYEPFLWDRATFNGKYSDVAANLRLVGSVSVEAMYHHSRIPLILGEHSEVPPESKVWLRGLLTPADGKSHYLGKMIRANGRISLIREISPQTRLIFLIRNPVDVINSASQLFSFYGTEFHSNDFTRFKIDVASGFDECQPVVTDNLTRVEKEYIFWLYSNRAFLEFARNHPENILTIAYEAFVEQRNRVVREICEFVQVEYMEGYTELAKSIVGPTRQQVSALTSREHDFLLDTLSNYEKFMEGLDLRPSGKIDEWLRVKTPGTPDELHEWTDIENYTGAFASRALRDAKTQIENQQVRIQDLQRLLNGLQQSRRVRLVNWLLSPLDKMRKKTARE